MSRVVVTLDAEASAVTDVLLAIEGFAERVYPDRRTDAEQQAGYNALGDIVLPLRAARDEALA